MHPVWADFCLKYSLVENPLPDYLKKALSLGPPRRNFLLIHLFSPTPSHPHPLTHPLPSIPSHLFPLTPSIFSHSSISLIPSHFSIIPSRSSPLTHPLSLILTISHSYLLIIQFVFTTLLYSSVRVSSSVNKHFLTPNTNHNALESHQDGECYLLNPNVSRPSLLCGRYQQVGQSDGA